MRFLLAFGLAATVGIASARAVPESHVVHEKRDIPRSNVKRIESTVRMPMRIGLKQNKDAIKKAENWLMDVAHPQSEKYGQHWSSDDVVSAFAPSEETVKSVASWLTEVGGIAKERITHSSNKAWFAFDASVEEAEALLHTEYYSHGEDRALVACDEYHLPKHLQEHIDYVTPGVKGTFMDLKKRDLSKRGFAGKAGPGKPFGWQPINQYPKHKMPPMPWNETELETCDKTITPACIRALYKVPLQDPHAKVSPSNAMGIYEQGDYYGAQDLDLFFRNFTPWIPNGTYPKLDSIDGGFAPIANLSHAGGESDLDFELAIPIIYPQKTVLYQTDDSFYAQGGSDTATGIFNTFFDALDGSYCTYSAYGETGNDPVLDPKYPDPAPGGYKGNLMCGVYKPANVISISYGEQESDLPAYYQERQCNEFLKLALQGVSIFVASGDTGVGGYTGPGTNGCLRNGTVFSPTQPNSCPWLTNVGATKVLPGKTVFEPESAVNDPAGHPYRSAFSSGGGFSNIFTIPKYQSSAVAEYFKVAKPTYPYYYNGKYNNTNGIYNRNGRGIPDVAAVGDNIATYVGGKFTMEGGTSASSPLFAAIVNRIVEERIKIGKGPLGFINPALYEHPYVLNDITNGTNPGCATEGFSASAGWDPVTGLGTPNYPKMLKLFLSLP